MDVTEFLLARISEDEKLAREAREENPEATWEAHRTYDGVYLLELPSTHPDSDSYGMGDDLRMPREMAKHISNQNPSRVLAECKAKREIVEVLIPAAMDWQDRDYVFRALASPYASHPDFQPEWALERV